MILELIPLGLFKSARVKTLLSDGRSSIFRKILHESLIKKEVYINTPLIVYIAKGQQILKDSAGGKVVLQEGSLSFFPRDIYLVSDYVTNADVFEAFLFFIDDKIIDKFILSSNDKTQLPQDNQNQKENESESGLVTFSSSCQLLRFFESIKSVYHDTENLEALLEIKLLELFHLITIQDKTHRFIKTLISSEQSRGKRAIADFMENYYTRNLKVDDYAMLTGRSVSSFIRDFKRLYNTTPNQWLIEKRLSKAQSILVNNNDSLSVTDVAYEVGYESVSHFIKAYKRRFNVTPKKAQACAS